MSWLYSLYCPSRITPLARRGPFLTSFSHVPVLDFFLFLNKGPGVVVRYSLHFGRSLTVLSTWGFVLGWGHNHVIRPSETAAANLLGTHRRDVGHSWQDLPDLAMAAFCLLWTIQRVRLRPGALMLCPGKCGSFGHHPLKNF